MNTSVKDIIKNVKSTKGLAVKISNSESLNKELLELTKYLPTDSSISERIYNILNNIDVQSLCICGDTLPFIKISKGYKTSCGNKECKSRTRSNINKESSKKIDWGESINKQQKTNLQKYGYVSNLASPKEREKHKVILKELTGYEHPLQNPESKKKRHNTCIKNHGTLNFIHSNKSIQTLQAKYNTTATNCAQIPEIQDRSAKTQSINADKALYQKIDKINKTIIDLNKTNANIECVGCGRIMNIHRQALNYYIRNSIDNCWSCNPDFSPFASNKEKMIVTWLTDIGITNIDTNRRRFGGKEIDIFLNDYNLGIEFNGTYWHSELHKEKNYHLNKKTYIENLGFKLINVWEDDWEDDIKRNIIQSRIKNLINLNHRKIYGRKCQIVQISNKEAKEFYTNNHIQGHAISEINYALVYDNEIVSVMSFSSKNRFFIKKNRDNEIELTRFANLIGVSVLGGFSKLFKHFLKNNDHDTIISFAEFDWTDETNNVYLMNGFKFLGNSGPSYSWVVNGKRFSRFNFSKQKLIKEGYDKNKTEVEIMHERKYYRAWNSGNLKFIYNKL